MPAARCPWTPNTASHVPEGACVTFRGFARAETWSAVDNYRGRPWPHLVRVPRSSEKAARVIDLTHSGALPASSQGDSEACDLDDIGYVAGCTCKSSEVGLAANSMEMLHRVVVCFSVRELFGGPTPPAARSGCSGAPPAPARPGSGPGPRAPAPSAT